MNEVRELKLEARKGQHAPLNQEKLRMLLSSVRAATAGVELQTPQELGDVARRNVYSASELVSEVRSPRLHRLSTIAAAAEPQSGAAAVDRTSL
jgi:hypothetical protein